MADLTPNHPAVEAVAREIYVHDAPSNDPQTWPPTPTALADDYRGAAFAALNAAREHYTANDLRDTPAGRELIREGIAAARNLEWMRPLMTPGGHIFNPAIPGDELRAVREDALAREAMQNMRESEQGRALMAEAWDQAVAATDRAWNHAYEDHPVNPDSPYYECTSCDTTNPYRAEEGK